MRHFRYRQTWALFLLSLLCTILIVSYIDVVPGMVKIIPDKFDLIEIVIDDVMDTCDDVTTFTHQREWAVVIVTESEKYISGCRLPNCFQLTWTYFTENMNHFETSRFLSKPTKLSGYLYAIQNGAKVILDADCNTQVEGVSKSFHVNDLRQSGFWTNDTMLFNPFHFYGILDAFPSEIYTMYQNLTFEDNSDEFYVSE